MRLFLSFLSSVVLLALPISIIGCSYEEDEEEYVIETMPIHSFEISVSESRPADVTVQVEGFSIGCDSYHETRHWIEGNTINIEVTVRHPTGSGFDCPSALFDYHEQINIGSFANGEYIVKVKGPTHFPAKFRIEDDESWIIKELDIAYHNIVISKSRPAQVSVEVNGFFFQECLEFLETHHTRDGNTINIKIAGKIPVSGNCSPKFGDVPYAAESAYQSVIDIGTLTQGSYEVIINDKRREAFRID